MTRRVRSAIYKYYAHRCMAAIGFIAPFLNVFLVRRGVTFTDLAVGGSAMATVTVVMEVPTGYVGDRIGRRTTLLASQVLFAVGVTSWTVARSTGTVVAVFVTFGFAVAFQSGSDSAWLYDVLEEGGQADRFTAVMSRGSALGRGVTAATMLGGGVLYLVDPIYPFAAAAALSWIGVGIVHSFPRNARYEAEDATRLGADEALSAIRLFLTSPALRALIALATFFLAAHSAAGDYVQLVVVDRLPPSGLPVGDRSIPEFVTLGFVYAGFTAITAVVVDYADDLRAALGTGGAVLLVTGVGGAAMVVPLFLPVLTIPAAVVFMTAPTVLAPIHEGYVNDHAESAGRASVLSAVSFVGALVRVPFLLVGGAVADASTPTFALAVVGALSLALGASTVLLDRPLTVPPDSATASRAADATD